MRSYPFFFSFFFFLSWTPIIPSRISESRFYFPLNLGGGRGKFPSRNGGRQAGWGRHLKAAHPRTWASFFFIPFLAGAVSVPQKQWRGLDGPGRSGDKRGTAAPRRERRLLPGTVPWGREATEAAAAVLNPPFHFVCVGGVVDGWMNE